MKKGNKILRALVALLLVCMMFFAVSCGNDQGTGENTTTVEDQTSGEPTAETTAEPNNPGGNRGANTDSRYGELNTFIPPVLSDPE